MEQSDCIVFEGSNMAECHPVAFRWPMKAKVDHGAKLIHVDPRFTRTSAMCDIYAPIRAGGDVGLAHPQLLRADALAGDRLPAGHAGGLAGVTGQVAGPDPGQRAVPVVVAHRKPLNSLYQPA